MNDKKSPCHHGARLINLDKKGLCGHGAKPIVVDGQVSADLLGHTAEVGDQEREHRFCRMFGSIHSDKALIKLGSEMEERPSPENPDLPAGYTYLGQFIDHDVTVDKTDGFPTESVDPKDIIQGRSPVLDLDSLYGFGPGSKNKNVAYEEDGIHLKVGSTTEDPLGGKARPNDLPRNSKGEARIGDPRNDENLAIAQTHLAFIKFHNKAADTLEDWMPGLSKKCPGSIFEVVREAVTRHYHWIIKNDFLPRIVDEEILSDVFVNGPTFFETPEGEMPCMPVEFSVAAYRFGHSMIRDIYNWNKVFPKATLGQLFLFTNFSGNIGKGEPGNPPKFKDGPTPRTLPSSWIIDWRRFYDFRCEIKNIPGPNPSKVIDPQLADLLKDLKEFSDEMVPHLRSLATRNLLRGSRVGLPSGQSVADAMGIKKLTPTEIRESEHGKTLDKFAMLKSTPLWYYILREAKVQTQGKKLGAVGSRIVAETFHELIRGSKHSILKTPDWTPFLGARTGKFEMTDLLLFVNDLNPLGN